MQPTTLFSLALLALFSNAYEDNRRKRRCLTEQDTSRLIEGFTKVIADSPVNRTLAAEIIDQDFISISDSVNFVDQIPLNTTMTHSLSELLEQEAKLPAAGVVKDLFVAHNCDTITWYFEFATKPLPTRGIAILFVDLETKRIWKSYRESNVGATLAILGKPECKDDFKTSVGGEGFEPGRSDCKGSCGTKGY